MLQAGKPAFVGTRIDVRMEKPGCVKAVWDGGECIIGYGAHVMADLTEPCMIVASENASAYLATSARAVLSEEAPYTNTDKRPNESPAMQYVRRELQRLRAAQKALTQQQHRAKTLTAPNEGVAPPPEGSDQTSEAGEPQPEADEGAKDDKKATDEDKA